MRKKRVRGGIRVKLKNVIREFVFGMEDGLVSNLGLVLGVHFGGGSPFVVVLAGLASMFSGAFSMSAGSYLSAKSQREVFEKEIHEASVMLKENPKKYLAEMKKILKEEGFDKDEVTVLLRHFEHHNPSTFVINYVQKKVGISEQKLDHPLKNALTMFMSFFVGSLFPILPFVFSSGMNAVILAIAFSTAALFGVGVAKSKFTHRSWFKAGIEIVIVGLIAGAIGYLIGWLVGSM